MFKLLATIFISFVTLAVSAQQTFKNIIGPSPNAAAFNKYGDIPVSYYTGIPNINIPIYTIENKDIKVPISLSYHAGGIRVDEEASRVGLGWLLNAGGIINRQVNDLDDFHATNGYLKTGLPEIFSSDLTEDFKRNTINVSYDNGSSSTSCTRTLGQTINFSGYVKASSFPQDQYDLEPDVFTYNFLSYTGKFVIKKDKQIVKQSSDALDIKLLNADGSSWQITTPDGIKYIFSKTESCRIPNPSSSGGFDNYITSWYLSKIISNTGAEVVFHYSSDIYNTVESLYSFQEKDDLYSKVFSGASTTCLTAAGGTKTFAPAKFHYLTLLDSISYPHGSVSFDYLSRLDIKNDKRISKIKVNNHKNASYNTSYELVQDYFVKNDATATYALSIAADYKDKRLKLTAVEQKDASGIANQKYQFLYNETSLPPKNSLARDHWGFYNGFNNSTLIPSLSFLHPFTASTVEVFKGANREPNPSVSQAFLLKEIQYPTGGKTRFDYEQNDYDIGNSIHQFSQVSNLEIEKNGQTFYTRRLSGTANDEVFYLTISKNNINSNVELNMRSLAGVAQTGASYPEDMFVEIYNASNLLVKRLLLGQESFWSSDGNYNYHRYDLLSLPDGNYTVKTHVGSNVLFLNYIELSFSYYSNRNRLDNHDIRLAGGVRLQRITSLDGATNQQIVKRFQYNYKRDNDGNGTLEDNSYGKRLGYILYTNYEYVTKCANGYPGGCLYFNVLCY